MQEKSFSHLLKVVTVEDSSIIVTRVKGMLDEMPGVHFMGNAQAPCEAIILLESTNPDVLILDINLRNEGGDNGIDLLLKVRKQYREMKIIMLTNMTAGRYRFLCRAAGADYFFDKSNEFEKIPEVIADIIKNKRSNN